MTATAARDQQSLEQLSQFIDGRIERAAGPRFAAINPANGRVIYEIAEATPEQVDMAVRAAKVALNGPWAKLSASERGTILRKLAARISERSDEFLRAEILDTGKHIEMASHLDIPRGAANFATFADFAPMVMGEAFPSPTPDGNGALNYSLRTPRGVIAVICPWNLPLLLMTWKVAPALMCGNTVVVKPSEETPTTAMLLASVMNEVGIPPGVFNVINGHGAGAAGEWLCAHPDVDGITFTGETLTGTAIMKSAAVGTRPVSFELGGKNAAIVFADCDMDRTVAGLMRSAFLNCGQVCLGTERVYVERPIFDELVARLSAQSKTLKPGDPFDKATTLGPLISAEHRAKVLNYYAAAIQQGASVATGGGIPEVEQELEGGFWIEPTIWTGLPETSSVVTEEIFGPCCHIAPFDDEDEAIALANNSQYGLAGSVWTQNLSRAHRLALKIEVGTLWINSWFLRDLRAAFGGSKQSGIGREGGLHGLDFYTEQRNVCVHL